MLRPRLWRAAASSLSAQNKPDSRGTALMVHGAGGGAWEFRTYWQEVFEQRGWHVVAHDLEPTPAGLAHTALSDYVAQVSKNWMTSASDIRDVPLVIIGASMGGAIALQAAGRLEPRAVVLVNSVVPRPWALRTTRNSKPIPDVMRWAGSSFERTAAAMPDSTAQVQQWAASRWRDESGCVLRELRSGYDQSQPKCRTLFVVGRADRDVPAEQQLAWAASWDNSSTLIYSKMSHVGPLLGTKARQVAQDVENWLSNECVN